MLSDEIINLFYHVVHLVVIVFSTFGWLIPKSAFLHISLLFAIALSWIGGGLFFGLGYCFLTDWHWRVRERMGIYDNPHSYTKLLFDQMTGRDIAPWLIDTLTVGGLLTGILGAIWRRRKMHKAK